MSVIRIGLTKWQDEMLKPFFNEARKLYFDGSPAAIFAQVFKADSGFGFFDVRVVGGEKGRAIQKAAGVTPGKTTKAGGCYEKESQ